MPGQRENSSESLVQSLLADLSAERDQLLRLVKEIAPEEWASDTPSAGWSVRDQVAHLAFFDEVSLQAIADPSGFALERDRAMAATSNFDQEHLDRVPRRGPDLLSHWAVTAEQLQSAVLAAPAGIRVPWYGLDMRLPSMLSARIMEHWAHGHDVASGLGTRWEATDRLRHVAHLAVQARAYGYIVRGLQPSQVAVRVELLSPSGASWTFGPDDAPERIVGTAEDFCLVLVRRRHVDDTALLVEGAAAREWLVIGQAYAGQPGVGPPRADV